MSNTVIKPDIISSHSLLINIGVAISHSTNRIQKVYILGIWTCYTKRFYESTISIRVTQLCTYEDWNFNGGNYLFTTDTK